VDEHRGEWRKLTHNEKAKYAVAVRRLNLGYWGYALSTLRAVHLTTREGDDNTSGVFARDLRKTVGMYRSEGYGLEYCGALELSPGKRLLHWHGLWRISGGYFPVTRRMLGDRWNECHGAFVVKMTPVNTNKELREYIVKHILKEYVGEDERIRNKFLFSKGWMREGWKEVQGIALLWVLDGKSSVWMNKERWALVNEIMQAWAEKRTVEFSGVVIDGERTGYLYMVRGRIREVRGGAFGCSEYEYYDF
jgi:hypothetical protein